jgi:D-3-phosphoglycerate dehydrogenase / 2-oxoglutarate reductase
MSDIFDGGAFVGVVNAPDLGAVAQIEEVVPYVLLGEKIGSMQAQLLRGNKISSITINLRGKDVADLRVTDVIKAAVIKGALSELVDQQLSYINALSVAEEIGLKVLLNISEKTEPGSGYMNTLAVELEIEGMLNMSRTVEGSVFGKNDLRITNIDGFNVDLPPGRNMLLFNNHDQPGVLKRVAEKLAAERVNIAHFSLGRKAKGKSAMGVIVMDSPLPTGVVAGLGKSSDISNVIQV